MQRRSFMSSITGGSAVGAVLMAAGAERAEAAVTADNLAMLLAPLAQSHALPGLGAAVVRRGRVVAQGVTGLRAIGRKPVLTLQDRFHIGSDTKAITATLAGTFVDQGALSWDSKLGDSFPDLVAMMDKGLAGVTLAQLLSHTSGLPSDNDAVLKLLLESYGQFGLNPDQLRLWLLKQWAPNALEAAPGSRFAYSNLGYTFAGAMLERAGKAMWEELVIARIFEPLRLGSGGFGLPSSPGRIDGPLGHVADKDGTLTPLFNTPNADVPPVYGPAGTVHLSLGDFARWALWNVGGGRGMPALVKPETLKRIHTAAVTMPDAQRGPGVAAGTAPPQYALGWGIATLPFAPDRVLTHTGSNSYNTALIIVSPERGFGMVLCTNVAGEKINAALMEAAGMLFKRYV